MVATVCLPMVTALAEALPALVAVGSVPSTASVTFCAKRSPFLIV